MGHSILNIESIAALVFLLVILLRPRTPRTDGIRTTSLAPESRMVLAVVLAAVAPYLWALSFPLLHDSYDLVYMANTQSGAEILRLFHAPAGTDDHFYRPLAFLVFWLYAKVAHYHPLPWHAFCIAGHVANSALVYLLARRLRFDQLSSAFAALLFAWHGSRPEAVAWVATRVDILATFFTLAALLAALRYLECSRRSALPLALIAAACAVLSKEAAYTLPLLFLCCAYWLTVQLREVSYRRAVSGFAALTLVCGGLFVCRFFILDGIGGYQTANGTPTALSLSPMKIANALLYRQWAIVFFPINWSERSALLTIGLCAAVLAMITALTAQTAKRKYLFTALAFMLSAVLPAQHMLLIGTDLNGARVLYLPLIGFALFWAAILQAQASKGRRQTVIAASLLTFQLCALLHNLKIWHEVADTSQRVCAAMAEEVRQGGSPIWIDPLPATRKGVFFLANGFAPCVMANSGGKLTTPPILIQQAPSPQLEEKARSGKPHYSWNEAAARIERLP